MALMTAIEASYGGAEAAARNAARSEMDALVARVETEYDLHVRTGEFHFLLKERQERIVYTFPTFTDAGELEVGGDWFYAGAEKEFTLPLAAFIEYSRRRVYKNYCRKVNDAYAADAAGIPAQQVEARA